MNKKFYRLSRFWALGAALALVLILAAKIGRSLESGSEFLRIDTDARAGAMSSAGTASAIGISAISYNPAGLASMKRGEAALTHSAWYLGSMHDFIGAGFALPGSAGWKMGLSFTRLSSGKMEGRTASRSKAGGYSAYDQAAGLALARQYGVYSLGGVIKYLESSIAGVKGTGYAVDLGLRRGLRGVPVSVGAAVQNLGPGIKYMSQRDQLPLSVSAGIMYMPLAGFMLNFDARRYVYDKYTAYSLGTEYVLFGEPAGMAVCGPEAFDTAPTQVLSGLSLRGGVNGAPWRPASGAFSTGAGIRFMNADLDYALSPEGKLGSIQRITLKKRF